MLMKNTAYNYAHITYTHIQASTIPKGYLAFGIVTEQ